MVDGNHPHMVQLSWNPFSWAQPQERLCDGFQEINFGEKKMRTRDVTQFD